MRLAAAAHRRVAAPERVEQCEPVSDVEPPSFSGLSYNAQYAQIFSQPLNLKRMVPKPEKDAQSGVAGAK